MLYVITVPVVVIVLQFQAIFLTAVSIYSINLKTLFLRSTRPRTKIVQADQWGVVRMNENVDGPHFICIDHNGVVWASQAYSKVSTTLQMTTTRRYGKLQPIAMRPGPASVLPGWTSRPPLVHRDQLSFVQPSDISLPLYMPSNIQNILNKIVNRLINQSDVKFKIPQSYWLIT